MTYSFSYHICYSCVINFRICICLFHGIRHESVSDVCMTPLITAICGYSCELGADHLIRLGAMVFIRDQTFFRLFLFDCPQTILTS